MRGRPGIKKWGLATPEVRRKVVERRMGDLETPTVERNPGMQAGSGVRGRGGERS